LAAQQRREPPPRVPEAFAPPAGLCRVWVDGVPATQQPAPTDCANAIRNRPTNAVVLFGPASNKRRADGEELDPLSRFRGTTATPRFVTPNALTARRRDEKGEAHDRPADSTAKAPRKPERPY